MKLKNRLIVAFVALTCIPVVLSAAMMILFAKFQTESIEKTYGVSGTTMESMSNTTPVIAKLTEKVYQKLANLVEETPERMDDVAYLDKLNRSFYGDNTYLIVRKDSQITYIGTDADRAEDVIAHLPEYGEMEPLSENGLYLGGEVQALVKQVDFHFPSGEEGSAFIVMEVGEVLPEVKEFFLYTMVGTALVLAFTAFLLIFWIRRGIMRPLAKMQEAAQNIKEGNLDFELHSDVDDEMGRLCMDLEDMRKRLKDNAQEKLEEDRTYKELISNISHDLRTPVTTIKGYAEGIMDGVADTPEKMGRYVRTIYNKAAEMDTLINELTLYSQIDTNRIPYNFSILSVNDYFEDCSEELSLELEARGTEFSYYNYVEKDVRVIADAEQIGRVIHNIVNNSLKYMDKEKGKINLRVKDVGDFVQVELEDNGRGIAARDLPNIFDRFYRADTSRNSSGGGSGIGLSIVKKILEEHGGKVWATSREHTGTTVHFVLRKYQEVPNNE